MYKPHVLDTTGTTRTFRQRSSPFFIFQIFLRCHLGNYLSTMTPSTNAFVGFVLISVTSVSAFVVAPSCNSGRIPSTKIPMADPGVADIDNLEAILWDMDGVLADTERDAHRPAFNQVFEEKGLDTVWDVETYGKLLEVGGGKERMTAHWNNVGWPTNYFSEDDDEATRQDKVKALHLRKTDVFNGLIKKGGVPLRPGVLRVVDEAIAKGKRLAVCSTSSEIAVRNLVETLFGPERFEKFQIFAGDMVAKKKPAPDVYLLAVDTMGLDKSRCVIVEDSHIGLGAAKAAGIACIVTKSSYTKDEDFTGASMIVDELGDDDGTGSYVTLETLAGLTSGSVTA